MNAPVRSGLDVLLGDPRPVAGKRAALLASEAAVTAGFVPARRALREAGVDLARLFGPGGPAPAAEDLAGLDIVICDLPDSGSRLLPFAHLTADAMAACARAGVPMLLLDRPNPLGGLAVEGNLPDSPFAPSLLPLPPRHGMTPGELARWVNAERAIGCELAVVSMRAADRPLPRRRVGETPAWVPVSPDLPTPASALAFAGTALLDGTSLSAGRGTARPYEVAGAPWLHADAAADAANAMGLPGVVFRPHAFDGCSGVQLHVTDPGAFRPFETGLRLVAALRALAPGAFAWRGVDALAGTARFRALVDAGEPLDPWIASFADDLARFAPARARALLYADAPRAVQVVGAHDSGKTRLAVALVAALAQRGVAVGALKETPHEYPTDALGKDSERLAAAGANPALLVAGRRTARHAIGAERPDLDALLAAELREAEVVVVEGWRRARLPKVEVCRAATGRESVAEEDESVIAVVTDRPTNHPSSVPRLPLHDLDGAVAFVLRFLGVAP